ncbi:MAG: galactitol-1-phosphate 5-dehydrogenase [Bacteroidales bacterium]|nr:galactitol-1-phosphate 5-dehydrogenase [Bacteroidales bacterium]
MKALLYTKPFQLEYVDYPDPEIKDDEVLVQVKACSICGSDVHGYTGTTGRRIPPLIMGHEASGIIAAAGSNVNSWKKGDHVTFDSTISCGTCYFCRQGRINLCNNRRVLGVSCAEYKRNGAFADFVVVPQQILYKLPEGLAFEKAALAEPLSVAVHAINRTPVNTGDTIVVIGAGMIGLLVIQALRSYGHSKIIAVDNDQDRLDLALKIGATKGLNSDKDDVTGEVFQMTDSMGADVVFEAVGITPTVATGIKCLKKGGAISLIGNLSPNVEIPLQAVVTRELSLYGSCISAGEYPACLKMIAIGAVNMEILISAVAPLSEGAAWFRKLYEREPGLMKVVLIPGS